MDRDETALPILRDLVRAVFRHRRMAVAVYAGIVATAMIAIFVLPPQYRAASEVLVTANTARVSTSAEKPTEFTRATPEGDAALNSQVELVRSRALIATVLRDLGADAEPPPGNIVVRILRAVVGLPLAVVGGAYRWVHGLTDEADRPLSWSVKSVLESTDVQVVKGSNVIEIAFQGTDAYWARAFVDRLTSAYVERQAELQSEGDAEAFFTKQVAVLRQRLAESETELHALREKAGTLAGQQAEVHDRLNEFDADLARTKIARAEQDERVGYLRRTVGAQQQHTGGVATPELLALEAKRAELVGKYQPESERLRDVDEQIKRLRAAVGSYDVAGPKDNGVDLTVAQAALYALKGKEDGLARQRDEYSKKAELLDAQSLDLARLERQTKLDEDAYVAYQRAAEQSRLTNAMEQSKMLRLSIVEPAIVSPEPVAPKKGLILLLAVLGGLAVSVLAAVVKDRLDGTIKTADDVRRLANVEVLAFFPEST
jgi:uncharacterized protein involved in exopolysaccharide biosynthesis